MITIRVGHVDDFELLATLGRRAFYEAFGKYNDPGDMQAYLDLAFNPDNIRKHLKDPEVIYFIALYKNDPVGYSKMKRNSAPEQLAGKKCIQLERIYCLDAYIGKKIGRALMKECLEKSNEEKFDYLWLGVWQQNERAIRFYKNFGMEVIGVKQFMIGKEVNEDFVFAIKLEHATH